MDFRKNRQDELIELQKMIEDTDDVIEDGSGEDEYKTCIECNTEM